MTLADVGEMVKVLGSAATAGAACYAAYIASRGLEKWRAETIGKRKAELAEDVLADFYEAKDIIVAARNPGSLGGEGDTRQALAGETDEETRYRNALWRTIERLDKKREFFAQLDARRYRFRAYFGADAAKPYDDLVSVHAEIKIAARMLIETHREHYTAAGSAPALREKWQAIIGWGVSGQDELAKRLDRIVEDMESTCRPIIRDAVATNSRGFWRRS
jgi:hypothetical protein